MPADNHKELFGNFLSGQMCPVINEMTDWERREAQGVDRYGCYGDIDSRSGSSDYDDPQDYHEWCDWSDVGDIVTPSEQMWGKELSLLGVHRGWSQWWLSCEITGLRRARPF